MRTIRFVLESTLVVVCAALILAFVIKSMEVSAQPPPPPPPPPPSTSSLESFVMDMYQLVLRRTPSAAEVSAWVGYLEANPTLAGASTFVHAAFDGPEYRAIPVTPWDYVTTLYQAILGRLPALEEVTPWVNNLLARFNTILPIFVNSAEFQSLVPNCRDPHGVMTLVTRLYQQALGRTPSQAEVDSWTNYIVATCDVEGTIRIFFNSSEYLSVARTLDQHVTSLYRALLAREPDAGGLQGFATYLAGQLAQIEDFFINSTEFQVRFQSLFQ